MKLTQNTIIHVLLGAAVLTAIALLYLGLAHYGQMNLSPLGWTGFGTAALALVLGAFLPSLLRRWRGLPPPQPLSSSDIGFLVMVTIAAQALAVIGVFSEMWWLMTLGIMLAPLAIMLRFPRVQRPQKN
jgi:hypothetical protein